MLVKLIILSGPQIFSILPRYMTMLGYWADEIGTRKDLTRDRWYHTGDTATMNEDGSVMIVGRTKEMICRGGENIYPTEIEQQIHKFPYVADVQVIGVPDDRLGEAVCAWVRLRDEFKGKISPENIIEACKGKLSPFKIPKYVLIKEEKDFPMTATGKVGERKTFATNHHNNHNPIHNPK
ncbi:hypothetical protein ANCCEY_07912 [Ancylostoma ceylanicum]|uniref:AMP-binding enzyme C-terminal domain-containing protein n=1 Tax=Ancylostoma ceylanicum TaxID=53326 RepID=A0A0D6LSI1_9BILA|nr:hypothetical protein ANCCEY_07912 [Ancylostoma ceylanicum]